MASRDGPEFAPFPSDTRFCVVLPCPLGPAHFPAAPEILNLRGSKQGGGRWKVCEMSEGHGAQGRDNRVASPIHVPGI